MKMDIFEKIPQLKEISNEKFPKHVLIIPDSNPIINHRQGFEILKEVFNNLQELPIDIITILIFAADNWKKSKKEITELMGLFEKELNEITPQLIKNKNKFIHLGRKDRIPFSLQEAIKKAEKATKNNKNKILCLAIDFGGEDQELRIMQAIKKLSNNIVINSDLVKGLRDGQGEIPSADLIIKISDKNKTSDIGWLGINSEFYSISKILPDTKTEDFIKAIIDYTKREKQSKAK
jgi:undecaprenyl diphosphate synthase